jgi:hypothetical protein
MQMLRSRFALIVAASAAALALTPTASAAYWFYTNYLPNGGGPRTVHQFGNDTYYPNYTRMSWTSGSHYMNFSLVDAPGNWYGIRAETANGYDQWLTYDSGFYKQGGCSNPSGLSTVWVNCHVEPT